MNKNGEMSAALEAIRAAIQGAEAFGLVRTEDGSVITGAIATEFGVVLTEGDLDTCDHNAKKIILELARRIEEDKPSSEMLVTYIELALANWFEFKPKQTAKIDKEKLEEMIEDAGLEVDDVWHIIEEAQKQVRSDSFEVIAGTYEDNGDVNCKYSSEEHKTLKAAIDDFDKHSSRVWAYIESEGRYFTVLPRDFSPF